MSGCLVLNIGAAGMLTVLRTILADSRSLNMNNIQGAIMTVLYTIGFCIGPVIGGALTEISFRWVFAIKYVDGYFLHLSFLNHALVYRRLLSLWF